MDMATKYVLIMSAIDVHPTLRVGIHALRDLAAGAVS